MGCLEVICLAESSSDAAIKLKAHIFLAEMYGSIVIRTRDDKKISGRERKMIDRCEDCVLYAEKQLERDGNWGNVISKEWKLRLYRAKYFAGKLYTKRNHASQLNNLCEAIVECVKYDHNEERIVRIYEDIFVAALKDRLIRIYDAVLMHKETKSVFESHLRCIKSVLDKLPNVQLQVWMMIVNYHTKITTSFGTSEEACEILNRTNQLSSQIRKSQVGSSTWCKLKFYQRILSCFVLSSIGDYNEASNILRKSKAVILSDSRMNRVWSTTDDFMTLVLDLLDVCLLAKCDSVAAIKKCADLIHRAQNSTADSARQNKIAPGLLGVFFDLLHLYCELQFRQCRFFAMCQTIHQTLQMFSLYKSFLVNSPTYSYIISRIYISIAKYMIVIRCKSGAQNALKRVIECHLLPIDNYIGAYPDCWIEIWLEILDLATYDAMIATEIQRNLGAIHSPDTASKILHSTFSKLADGILHLQVLKALVLDRRCLEWQAKFALFEARAKRWSCGQSDANSTTKYVEPFHPVVDSRNRISNLKTALRSHNANSAETTAELSAMLGYELILQDQLESGESVLKNAIRISLHTKSLLLQLLTLVSVHRLYSKKSMLEAKHATEIKHGKKLLQFNRRVSEARGETARNEYILKWIDTDL
ncbi:hypothetical protein ABG067_002762 [Albugo candida]